MEPLEYIALANAAVSILETVVPKVQAAVSKGEITVDQQADLQKRIDALRPGGAAFSGPEWQKQ